MDNHIIGSHFFEEFFDGKVYIDFFLENISQLLENVQLSLRINMDATRVSAHSAFLNLKCKRFFLRSE